MKPVLIVQNCEAEQPGIITDYLAERNRPYSITCSYAGDPFPPIDQISAFINLGCPHSATRYDEVDYLRRLFQYVSEASRANLPYLGICFGGQLLARVHGAEVRANPSKEIGTYSVRLTDQGQADPLFAGFDTTFPVFQWHTDTFKIPFGAPVLASSELCANQAFRIVNQVALQFHLETRASDVALWCDEYAEEMAAQGVKKTDLLADYDRHASQITNLSFKFLDNFFRLTSK